MFVKEWNAHHGASEPRAGARPGTRGASHAGPVLAAGPALVSLIVGGGAAVLVLYRSPT